MFDLKTNTITATTKLEPAARVALTWSPDGKLLGTVQEGRWTLHSSDRSLIALGFWEHGIVLPLAQVLPVAA